MLRFHWDLGIGIWSFGLRQTPFVGVDKLEGRLDVRSLSHPSLGFPAVQYF
jgi:hypothetical protein